MMTEDVASSGAPASDPVTVVLVQIQVVVLDAANEVNAVTGQPPMDAPAVAGLVPPASALLDVIAAVTDVSSLYEYAVSR